MCVFPYERLTPIDATPTFASLRKLRRELIVNATSQFSMHWGGKHGYLGLVLTADKYMEVTGHSFAPLKHPGPLPTHAVDATWAQITNADRAYDQSLNDYHEYICIRNRFLQQIISAVKYIYLQELEHPLHGLAKVSVSDILTHLESSYGHITHQVIEANRAKLLTAWSPDQPIEYLWSRHREIRDLAMGAGRPISDSTIMDQTIMLFCKVGRGKYQYDLNDWRRRPEAEKTYANFKLHFRNIAKPHHY